MNRLLVDVNAATDESMPRPADAAPLQGTEVEVDASPQEPASAYRRLQGWYIGGPAVKRRMTPSVLYYLVRLSTEGDGVPLRRPLKVELSAGEDFAVNAFAPAVGVWGCGNSTEAAFLDLGTSAIELYNNLSDTPADQLDASAQELLGQLRAFLG